MLTRLIRYAVIAVSSWMVIVHTTLGVPPMPTVPPMGPTPTMPPVQTPTVPPVTTPTVPPIIGPTRAPPVVPDLRPSATFTFADATQIKSRSTSGHFRFVGLHQYESVDVALQFSATVLSSSAVALPLDGGKILSFAINKGAVGPLASLRFQAGDQPGLYRVLVRGLGAPAMLHFWVADPNSPNLAMAPLLLNPTH